MRRWVLPVIAATFGLGLASWFLFDRDDIRGVDSSVIDARHRSASLPELQARLAAADDPANIERFLVALPPPNTPVTEVVRLLEKSALQGSAQAACRIAQEVWRCSNMSTGVNLAEVLAGVPGLPGTGTQSFSEALLDQADSDSAMCSGTQSLSATEAYRFQQIAADSGGLQKQRWLLVAPTLRQDRFLQDIDGWADYKRRSEAYVQRAISSKSADDLLLLLAIHSPSYVQDIRPPYQVDDTRTFLALAAAAERLDIAIPPRTQMAAMALKKGLGPNELAEIAKRSSTFSDGWAFKAGAKEVGAVFLEQQSGEFCQ